MVYMLGCDIVVVSEFELLLRYGIHFRIIIFWKGNEPLYPPSMG